MPTAKLLLTVCVVSVIVAVTVALVLRAFGVNDTAVPAAIAASCASSTVVVAGGHKKKRRRRTGAQTAPDA